MNLEAFALLNPTEKRELCLTILSNAKERWGIFLDLYELIISWEATDDIYSRIYSAAMIVLSEENNKKTKESIEMLHQMKDQLLEQRIREHDEKLKEASSANDLINTIL